MTELVEAKPLMSHEQIIELQRRVLANEPVTDEELRSALESLARARAGTATLGGKTSKSEPLYQPKGSIMERFAAMRAKNAE